MLFCASTGVTLHVILASCPETIKSVGIIQAVRIIRAVRVIQVIQAIRIIRSVRVIQVIQAIRIIRSGRAPGRGVAAVGKSPAGATAKSLA